MPIYEFVCRDCKKHFEVLTTSSSSTETVKCPACGSLDVTKTISASHFRVGSHRPSIPSGALSGCSSKSGFS
ncbi:FmdB family zinc ribbon protein [Thermodesulfobacteriota bacterium B35]